MEQPREVVFCVDYFEEVGKGRDWKLSFNFVLILKFPYHSNNDNIKSDDDYYNFFNNLLLLTGFIGHREKDYI